MGRRVVWMAGTAVVGLLLAGCGDDSDKAEASKLFSLKTGDCFDSRAGTQGRTVELDNVTALACTEAHDGEVFAVVTHPAARDTVYPGDAAVYDYAAEECVGQFPAYTGAAYDDSDLEVATVRPDEDSWTDRDDREIACVLYKKDQTLTGSRRKV